MEGGAVAIELGVELLTRVVPRGVAWIKTALTGRRILVVGQPRAGKTSLAKYLQFGVYADPSLPNQRTKKVKESAAFTIAVGENKSLELTVKSVIDVVGQAFADEHARNVHEYKPHCLVVMLDIATKWEGSDESCAGYYLRELCEHLSDEMKRRKSIGAKLQAIIVIVNKKDLGSQRKLAKWRKDAESMVRARLRDTYGSKANRIPVFQCTLLREADNGASAQSLVTSIARLLEE